jgi:N-sulfoglucosamine sulfohydrolase
MLKIKMKFSCLKKHTIFGLVAIAFLSNSGCKEKVPGELPNILWITSEDNSAYFLGCYGNSYASTPNLDKLAAGGFLYTHAYANCPVCAPARNTILTGVYAASNGNEQMRSRYPKSDKVVPFPEFLRNAGYYCTNNSKTDYNFEGDDKIIWDDCSNTAHYKNRPEEKPFFAVFNLHDTHESMIHRQIPANELRHDPQKVEIAPYHPNTAEIRHDWAQYYDRHEEMDIKVGELLQELEESGESENTIVFYYGDHGGVLARSKRYVYETGTHVPFILRIPEKFKHLFPKKEPGSKVDRLISFVDLAPTLLSITGIPIPEFMQGNAFLGSQDTMEPEYVFMTRQRMDERYDMVRAVRDEKYRYIKNYMPFRISMQHLDYLYKAPSAQSWDDEFKAGRTNEIQDRFFQEKPVEELYDTENDPWEIRNLANDPAYADVLERMRGVEKEWMITYRDVGLIPETEYQYFLNGGSRSMYDYMRTAACPFNELLEAAQSATKVGQGDINEYVNFLNNKNSAIRYWGAVGLLIHRENANSALEALEKAAKDLSGAVATIAAETLYRKDIKDQALNTYVRILEDTTTYSMIDRLFALNSLDAVNAKSAELIEAVKEDYESQDSFQADFARYGDYYIKISESLLAKWGVPFAN